MDYKIVEVIWQDAQSSLQQLSVEDAIKRLKPVLTRSVGYLVDDSHKEHILLAFTNFGNNQLKHWQTIPKGMIKGKIKVIK